MPLTLKSTLCQNLSWKTEINVGNVFYVLYRWNYARLIMLCWRNSAGRLFLSPSASILEALALAVCISRHIVYYMRSFIDTVHWTHQTQQQQQPCVARIPAIESAEMLNHNDIIIALQRHRYHHAPPSGQPDSAKNTPGTFCGHCACQRPGRL